MNKNKAILFLGVILLVTVASTAAVRFALSNDRLPEEPAAETVAAPEAEPEPVLDVADYDARMRRLAHLEPLDPDADPADAEEDPDAPKPLWPVDAAYPNPGAILPFHRIVAYYGNFYSTGMGVLGQYAPDRVLAMLAEEVRKWEEADPETPVMPAIDYIAVVAQAGPGRDGRYRARMPDTEIDKALALAERAGGIVILEVQPGLADLMGELRALGKYLSLPQVHLAIDPEFNMKNRGLPGRVVGTVDAADINAAAGYLAELVRENGLPPKVLIVHRYTRAMVTNARSIKPLPEVQIVMDMDGWGPPSQKFATYNAFIAPEPVQFTGFKLFYRNDTWGVGRLLTPAEILELVPRPSFIQYQ